MENQTCFNLNAAMQNWRGELAAQSSLALEARRELETHLCDTVAELRRRGLNDEESFWLARRRVGQPAELGEEFGKADPARVWRERVLWMAVALFAMLLWQGLSAGVRMAVCPPINPMESWLRGLAVILLTYLPVVWLAVSVARGRFITKLMAWRSIIRSRRRFLGVACCSVLAIETFEIAMMRVNGVASGVPLWDYLKATFLRQAALAWPAMLIALIVWLLPAEESQTLKPD